MHEHFAQVEKNRLISHVPSTITCPVSAPPMFKIGHSGPACPVLAPLFSHLWWHSGCASEAAMRLLLLFCLAGALCAQDITRTPDVRGYQGEGMVSRAIWKYLPRDMPHTQFYNSNRLESLMRAGNIYLSLRTPSPWRSKTISTSNTTVTTANRPRPTSYAPAPASCCASPATPRAPALTPQPAAYWRTGRARRQRRRRRGRKQQHSQRIQHSGRSARGIPDLETYAFASWRPPTTPASSPATPPPAPTTS